MRKYKYIGILRAEDGEVLGKISSSSIEGFEEELYKLEMAEERDRKEIERDIDEWEKERAERYMRRYKI